MRRLGVGEKDNSQKGNINGEKSNGRMFYLGHSKRNIIRYIR